MPPISPLGLEAVTRIDALFDIERTIRGETAARRIAVRREQSASLVAELEAWMRTERAGLSRHAAVAKAMDYMLKRWDGFARFLDDGRICLTNYAADRALRPLCLGRKSWLFAGSDRGGEQVAMASMVHERGTQARPDGARMTADAECRYYGRDFTTQEMVVLRALIAASPPPNRHALSREFCRRIGWLKPDGGLKDMMARVAMLAMHNDGLIVLPPPKWPRPPRRPMVFGPDTEPPPFPAPTILDEVRPLSLRPVVRYTREGKRWNEFVARYHYLGYKTLVGAQSATPSTTATAGRSPCSASARRHASSRPATASSDGRRNCARRTSPS